MVIVFHLKRFEHGHGKESTKIGSPVKFPEQLDMKPYLAESIASSNGLDAVRDIRPLHVGGWRCSGRHARPCLPRLCLELTARSLFCPPDRFFAARPGPRSR